VAESDQCDHCCGSLNNVGLVDGKTEHRKGVSHGSSKSLSNQTPEAPVIWMPISNSYSAHSGESTGVQSQHGIIQRTAEKIAAKLCPRCGGNEARIVDEADSNAIDNKHYLECTQCGASFRQAQSHRDYAIDLVIGTAFVAVAGLLYFLLSWTWASLAVGLWGAYLCGIGIRGLLIPSAIAIFVELLPHDERQPATIDDVRPSPKLQQWLESCAANDRPVSRSLRRFTGSVLSWVGGALAILAGLFAISAFSNQPGQRQPMFGMPFGEFLIAAIVMGVVGMIGMTLSLLGKGLKATAQPAWELLRKSTKSPVLYLRAFDDDCHPLWTGDTIDRKLDGRNLLSTVEDAISKTFEKAGPVVTIGRPGEWIPPSGALRAWLSDGDWKPWIHELVTWSQRVIMFMGDPESHAGLAWEVRTIFSTCAPHKIVLIAPPDASEDEIKSRWAAYRQILGPRFPEYRTDVVATRFTSSWKTVIVTFDQYRKLSREGKHDVFVATLEAFRNWRRPNCLGGRKIMTDVVPCDSVPANSVSGVT
jgi:hypothetical protein